MASQPTTTHEGVFLRRCTRFKGLFFDDFATNSAWIREKATAVLPPLATLRHITIRGETQVHPMVRGADAGLPELEFFAGNVPVAKISPTGSQPWEVSFELPPGQASEGTVITFKLHGVAYTNFLAWVGRLTESWPLAEGLQRFRAQNKNRQLRVQTIHADGELVFNFADRHAPYSATFARKHARLGINVVGFLMADLGVGESARCMLRAADAAHIPAAAVPLKLPCKARQGDRTYAAFVQDTNPHAVNIFHLDPPAAHDIDTHHGKNFRRNKYNIGYWAWELPEFPDTWLAAFDHFDEIWCPSEFVRTSIAAKSPVAVTTMPHAISFERPTGTVTYVRGKFKLPLDKYLFLFIYDLNSYSERKNPRAVIAAFRETGLAGRGATLVIKVHGAAGNEADLAALRTSVADLPGVVLLTESFSRSEIYALISACDCFVSLHRSEGYGLALAESMFLGKPVIATDWSATTEFLDSSNGCPVRCKLVALETSHGPYSKGQIWAEPDINHAAEWMQRLFTERAFGHRLGQAARARIEQRFSAAAIGARYRQRLEAIASW
jgi:glycosyltransferase involved in cell wall biosynthesis